MTNYVGTDLIRLFGINHPDEIGADNQYETGHITATVVNKVRVEWNRTGTVEYLMKGNLHKLDKNTFWVKSDNSDNTDKDVQTELKREEAEAPDLNDNSGNLDNFPVPVETVKTTRKPRNTRKAPETVKVDNLVTAGNGD
jgi:hypothetical protein